MLCHFSTGSTTVSTHLTVTLCSWSSKSQPISETCNYFWIKLLSISGNITSFQHVRTSCYSYTCSFTQVLWFFCDKLNKDNQIHIDMNGKSDTAVSGRNPLKWKEHLQQTFGGEMRNKKNTTCVFKIHSNMRGMEKIISYAFQPSFCSSSQQKPMLAREIAVKFKMLPSLTRGYTNLHLSTFTA